ncbi:MAG: DUF488 family protein [Terriglobia bacterium]
MPRKLKNTPLIVYTIGHSTRELPALLDLLREHGIQQLVDIRTIPRSRHNPQYNLESMAADLPAAGLRYVHLEGLGGLRHARRDSPNTAWRNASFRGFADYMQRPEFAKALTRLVALAAVRPTAIMCAEAVPWRCHRSLVSDALLVRGTRVEHIISGRNTQEHSLTPFARVEGESVTYPGIPPGIKNDDGARHEASSLSGQARKPQLRRKSRVKSAGGLKRGAPADTRTQKVPGRIQG